MTRALPQSLPTREIGSMGNYSSTLPGVTFTRGLDRTARGSGILRVQPLHERSVIGS